MEERILFIFFLVLSFIQLNAQNVNLPFGHQSYHWMDRLEIKSGRMADFHTSHKQYTRSDIAQFTIKYNEEVEAGDLTNQDFRDFKFIYRDNSQMLDSTAYLSLSHKAYEERSNPFLKYFLKTPANFFEHTSPDFNFVIQPVGYLEVGSERTEIGNKGFVSRTSGVILRGNIDNKVGFYTDVTTNLFSLPAHANRYSNEFQSIPGFGWYTGPYELGSADSLFDAFDARAIIDFNATEHIKFQMGHGNNFIGNGYRSLLLSDYGQNYLFLKINSRIWKFDYQNIFAKMRRQSVLQTPSTQVEGVDKYLAAHHISYNIFKNFNIGIFEGVVLARDNGFELNYINPIIFYRSVERNLDSPDNIIIGTDFKWNVARKFSLYGQLVLDELQISNLISNPDTWAHKFGTQLGLKYIDVFNIDHLDLQLEVNAVRPYTYQHFDSATTYTHFNQPLAHPLGANFREFLAIVRYQPSSKLFIESRLMFANVGRDTLNSNWGGDITRSYRSRNNDDGVMIGQGVSTNILLYNLSVSYMLFHNCFVDLNLTYRNENSEIDAYDYNSVLFTTGIRWNFWKPRYDF